LCLIAITPSLAVAGTITVSYSGLLEFSDIPNIPVGSPFTGRFTYTVPGVLVEQDAAAAYSLNESGNHLTLETAGFTFHVAASPSLFLYVNNGGEFPFTDDVRVAISFDSDSFSTNYPGVTLLYSQTWIFGGPNFLESLAAPNPFNTDEVTFGYFQPVSFPPLVYSSQVGIQVDYGRPFCLDGCGSLAGNILSIQATSETPEPRSWLLFGGGLAFLLAKRVRRSEL